MLAIIQRIIKQMLNDKRSLALILFAPLLIITLMYLLFGESTYIPKVATQNVPEAITSSIKAQDIILVEINGDIDEMLKEKEIDGVLYIENQNMYLKMYEPNAQKISAITKAFNAAIDKLNPNAQKLNISYIKGSQSKTTFDSLGYMFLTIFSFFFVFLIAGISFIRERTQGTMERFMLTPISRTSVVAGFILGFGFFAVLQSVLVVIYSKFVLSLTVEGSLISVIVIMVLLAFVAVALGALVSVFANNEFQVVQFIPIIIVPQIFFSGLISIDTLPYNLDKLAYIMPVYYASCAMKEILIFGSSLLDVYPYCLALIGFILILFLLNIKLLKKYRTV